MNESKTTVIENYVHKELNLLGKYLLGAAVFVAVAAAILPDMVHKQSSSTLDSIVRKTQANQPSECNIYRNKSGNYDCVEIMTATGSHYYPIVQKKAKTFLGLVDSSLTEGKKGYSHEMLAQLIEYINGGINVVREDRDYLGLGPERSKPAYLK
ncbi:MAG: hypothetical protein Q7J54_05500 [Candidatus Woesearchaeota archaeon]|nr:hypothetical protein [Candidatus Woesearchaeota archaeon]